LHVCKKIPLIFALLILDRYIGTQEKPGKCKGSGRKIEEEYGEGVRRAKRKDQKGF